MAGLTGFTVGDLDLSLIFQPYYSGTNPTTNYITNMNGYPQDLSSVFQQLGTTNPNASDTKFKYTDLAGNEPDLNTLFAGKVPFTTTGLISTTIYSSNTYTITITEEPDP
jgi:hypothetical protein